MMHLSLAFWGRIGSMESRKTGLGFVRCCASTDGRRVGGRGRLGGASQSRDAERQREKDGAGLPL